MPTRTRSRPRRRNSALPRSLSHAPFSNSSVNVACLYGGLQEELDTIQRLKLPGAVGDMRPLEDVHSEFVAAYKTICRSLLQHLDRSNFGGLAPPIIKLEIHRVCEDATTFINRWFLPVAQSPDDYVFLRKSMADFRRYICMAYEVDSIEARSHSCLAFNDYMTAFEIASEWLNPANPNRLGLTLNFALFYREVLGQNQHACHLAKFGFDEAVRLIDVFPEYEISESSFSALSILKGHLISWTSQP